MRPYFPIPRFVQGEQHSALIRRALRRDIEPEIQRLDLVTTTQLRISLEDSGLQPVEHTAEGDTCVHVLYQSGEENSRIEIGGEQHAITPGDFAWVPAGDTWQLSSDQLAITISVRSNSLALPIDPTHGEYRFDGYNRETVAPAASGVSLSRWKVTQPLTLPGADTDRILIGLWNDLAVQYPGGVSMLQQGKACVIRPGSDGVALVPDGLAYVLAIETR